MIQSEHSTQGKKQLLLVGSGQQAYREYALCSMASRYPVALIESHEPTWQSNYIEDSLVLDLEAPSAVIDAVRAKGGRSRFCGVVTYDEWHVDLASAIARDLGLPSNGADCSRRCRDKHLMRQSFSRHGVPSARSLTVTSLAEARQAAEQIGLPVVMKPRALAASIGVVKVETLEEIEDAYSIAASAFHPGAAVSGVVLVEEFLSGPEVSVESIATNGDVKIVAITQKQVGFAPFFEEVGHFVCARETLPEESRIREVVIQAHQALGVTVGATHAEVRLTPAGPKMVELAARLGGDLIPKLVHLATGVDLALAAADVAAGVEASLVATKNNCAAVRFLYPSEDCRVVELGDELSPHKYENWGAQVQITARIGDELRLPPRGFGSRLGYIIVEAVDSSTCQERLDALHRDLKICTEPLRRRSRR